MIAEGKTIIEHDGYTRAQERSLPAVATTPMQMIAAAVASGASIEYLQQLMALRERYETDEARKAYNVAFASFKAETIIILRNKPVTDGPLKGKSYAELFSIVDAVTPALSKHGLSAAWKLTKDDKDWLEVTCTLRHVLGHSESVSMGGPPDAGGAKNAIQARASTVTYLEKYTLKAICGVSEQGDDKDGGMDEGAIADHIAAMDAAADLPGLQKAFGVAYKSAEAAKDKGAMKALIRAKDVRKALMVSYAASKEAA